MDGDKLERLTPAQQRVAGRFVNAGGEDAVRTFNRLDSEALDDLLSIGVRCIAGATASTSEVTTLAGEPRPSNELVDE